MKQLTGSLLMILLSFAVAVAQPWPRQEKHIVDNNKKITDASVQLFHLHSDYDFPYIIPSKENVTEKLLRICNFLEGTTMKEFVDATGKPVEDPSKIPANFSFGKTDFRPYSYEWGVTYSGMLMAANVTGEKAFSDYVTKRMDLLSKGYPIVVKYHQAKNEYKSPISSLINPHDLDACGSLTAAAIRTQLQNQNINLKPFIHRSAKFISAEQYRMNGKILARNRPYPNTLWLDDLYMAIPALAQLYAFTNDEKYLDDAVHQLLAYTERMYVKEKGLFMHAWVEAMESHPAFFWGRANGWATLAMCDLLTVMPQEHPFRSKVLSLYKEHCNALLKYQSGKGMWHQLLDRNDSYLETSGTAIFVYGLAHGINQGWLDAKIFGAAALSGWNALSAQINNVGQVENACVGTSIAFEPAYYYQRKTHPYTAHGYGPTLMAGSAILRLLEHTAPLQATTIYFHEKN